MPEVNGTDEKFKVSLTEWEIDTLYQLANAYSYPGNNTEVASNMIKKLKDVYDKGK